MPQPIDESMEEEITSDVAGPPIYDQQKQPGEFVATPEERAAAQKFMEEYGHALLEKIKSKELDERADVDADKERYLNTDIPPVSAAGLIDLGVDPIRAIEHAKRNIEDRKHLEEQRKFHKWKRKEVPTPVMVEEVED